MGKILPIFLGIVGLQVRPHVVFDEDVLHTERGVMIVKTEGGGESDVVVESVGFGHLSSDFVRCLLVLFSQERWYFVVEKTSSFFSVNPHFGKSLKSEESIVKDLHRFSGIGILCLVYGDDDVGHVFDIFVEIFKDFHTEGAKSAPRAGAFLYDLRARKELWGCSGLHGGCALCCGALRFSWRCALC